MNCRIGREGTGEAQPEESYEVGWRVADVGVKTGERGGCR